ncbi:phage tail tube protein [Chitinophaga sp. Hz27]|uniref:phage tail tube protein n=1 Tax=Chitinophaga sp. Hz27 TaxID=3347169 RepID=UPI0035E05112
MNEPVMGKDLMLYTGDNLSTVDVICLLQDCTLTINADTTETTGPGGKWKRSIYSALSYSISGNGIVSYYNSNNLLQIQEQLIAWKKIKWKFTRFSSGGLIYSGSLLWTSVENTSPYSDASQFSFQAIGDGEVTVQKIPFNKTVYLANQNGVRLDGCPDVYPVRVYWIDGTPIGIAYDQVDVISQINNYPSNTDFTLTGYTTGCDFNLSAPWNAQNIPNWIIAEKLNDAFALSDRYINIIGDGAGNGLTPINA